MKFFAKIKNPPIIMEARLPYIGAVIVAALLFPFLGSAQSVSLQSAKTSYRVGDSFQVSFFLNTQGKPVNTVSGAIHISPSVFQIMDVRYGSSIVSLWVERPTINAGAGTISFTGGIPGGYNGSSGPILSFGLKANAPGKGTAAFDGIKVLLNDGLGTEVSAVSANVLALSVSAALPTPKTEEKSAPPPETYAPPPDAAPPEDFTPFVSRHPSVGNNRYFVSFFAVDKNSGIARYEIEERPWLIEKLTQIFNSAPTATESPYVLKQQWWASRVIVRAYDQAGNMREAEAFKGFHPAVVVLLGALWTGFIIATVRWYFVRRFNRRKPMRKK